MLGFAPECSVWLSCAARTPPPQCCTHARRVKRLGPWCTRASEFTLGEHPGPPRGPRGCIMQRAARSPLPSEALAPLGTGRQEQRQDGGVRDATPGPKSAAARRGPRVPAVERPSPARRPGARGTRAYAAATRGCTTRRISTRPAAARGARPNTMSGKSNAAGENPLITYSFPSVFPTAPLGLPRLPSVRGTDTYVSTYIQGISSAVMLKQVFGIAIVAACAEAFAFGPAISFLGRYAHFFSRHSPLRIL